MNDLLIQDFDRSHLENNLSLFTVNELLEKFDLQIPHIQKTSGAYNDVFIFQVKNSDQKTSLRISKDWHFKMINGDNTKYFCNEALINDKIRSNNNIYMKISQFLFENENSKKNWLTANELELCPEIFFYGYVKRDTENIFYFYPVILNEAYDTNIYDYYLYGHGRKYRIQNREINNDIIIENSIINILNSMVENMSMICYDIKPANCVLKFKKNTQYVEIEDLKLIDWDGDWCYREKAITKGNKNDQIFMVPFLISVMFMANHFLITLNWNIFHGWFQSPVPDVSEMSYEEMYYDSMKEYFCKPNKAYNKMAIHYFSQKLRNLNQKSFDNQTPIDEIFDILFENVIKRSI